LLQDLGKIKKNIGKGILTSDPESKQEYHEYGAGELTTTATSMSEVEMGE
jgi:hypothetical protein